MSSTMTMEPLTRSVENSSSSPPFSVSRCFFAPGGSINPRCRRSYSASTLACTGNSPLGTDSRLGVILTSVSLLLYVSENKESFRHVPSHGAVEGSEALRAASYSIFGIHVDFLKAAKGGFFSRKRPLECLLSVYSNSENAIAETSATAHLPQS